MCPDTYHARRNDGLQHVELLVEVRLSVKSAVHAMVVGDSSMEGGIDTQIATAEELLEQKKRAMEEIRNDILNELQKVYPDFIEREIEKFVEGYPDVFLGSTDRTLKDLKSEIEATVPGEIARVVAELKQSEEWFSCEEGDEYHSVGVGLGSNLWKRIESVDQNVVGLFEKRGIKVPKGAFGEYRYIAPLNWSWFGKQFVDLNDRLASAKTEYCQQKKELERLSGELRQKEALGKWRSA